MKAKAIHEGIIIYEITLHPFTRQDSGQGERLFSSETQIEIARYNIPKKKTVYFKAGKSRTEMLDNDYGFPSLSIVFRNHNKAAYVYCKSLQYIDFCEEIIPPAVLSNDKSFIPQIKELDETRNILGYLCLKAKITEENESYYVFYTDAVEIDEPTGAVLHSPGIQGVILEWEEIPGYFGADYFRHIRARTIKEQTINDSLFSPGKAYRQFDNIDEAIRENLRQLDQISNKELIQNPLTIQEKKQFEGFWLFSKHKDLILVEIKNIPEGASWNNQLYFTTYYLTAKGSFKKKTIEKAVMKGRKLFVEEKPNYRLYVFDEESKKIIQENFDFFIYKSIAETEAHQLIKQYGLE